MRQGVDCDQKVEGLHQRALPCEREPQLSSFVPEVVWLVERATTLEEGENPAALAVRSQPAPQLGDHRSTDCDLVLGEELIDHRGAGLRPSKEVHPGRGVHQDHRRVFSRSRSM